jgi:abortive infection bacteriophage resistance protein
MHFLVDFYNNGKKHSAYIYYKDNHGYYPFWVLSKVLTLGAVLGLYSVMKSSDKDYIARLVLPEFSEKKIAKKFTNMFTLIVEVRNICAHDDILYNFNTAYADIWKLNEHNKFDLDQYGNKVIGRNDLFATIISLKYLMNQSRFENFINRVNQEIVCLDESISVLDYSEILESINFPINFKDLLT